MRALVGGSFLVALVVLGCGSSGSDARPAADAGASAGGSAGTPGAAGTSTTAGVNAGGTPSVAGAPAGGGGQGGSMPAPGGGGSGPVVGDGKSHNMTWVSRYYLAEAKQAMSGVTGMAQGLDYLGLQFWITDGATARLSEVGEEDVTWFRDWAKQHNVKALLCVHNDIGGWNWPEGARSFRDNREAFVQNLVSQVQSRELDGVDIDIEGAPYEATADDQASYLAFIKALSAALKPMGKVLTLDSFHGPWNAPNWGWWDDLFPLVDGITAMGYEQSGLDTDYQDLVDHAVTAPRKLMIGVPSYHGSWLNHGAVEHLTWIAQKSQAGTGIWEAGMRNGEWQQQAVWDQLTAIRAR
jgi:hypothetical protein